MKMMSIIRMLFIFILSFPVYANNKAEVTKAIEPIISQQPDPSSNNRTSENEAELYKELYKVTLSKHENFISDLKWMITIITGIFLGLFGTQLFLNNRINRKEIDNINNSLKVSFAKLSADVVEQYSEFKETQHQKLNQTLDDSRKEIKSDVSSNLSERFNDFQSSNSERLKKLIHNQKNDREILEYKINNIEQYIWEMRGVKSNQLKAVIDSLNFEKTISLELSRPLSKILKLLNSMNDLDLKDKAKLESTLEDIVNQDTLIKSIKQKTQELPLYEIVKDQKGDTHFIYHKK